MHMRYPSSLSRQSIAGRMIVGKKLTIANFFSLLAVCLLHPATCGLQTQALCWTRRGTTLVLESASSTGKSRTPWTLKGTCSRAVARTALMVSSCCRALSARQPDNYGKRYTRTNKRSSRTVGKGVQEFSLFRALFCKFLEYSFDA